MMMIIHQNLMIIITRCRIKNKNKIINNNLKNNSNQIILFKINKKVNKKSKRTKVK